MKAALISLGSVSSKWIIESLKKYFRQVDDLNLKDIEVNTVGELEVLYKGQKIDEDYDCIYIKGSFRYQPIMRAVATAVYGKTYTPITPHAFTVGHDKVLTQLDLQKDKIPMPNTYLASSVSSAKKVLEKINYPIVMKFPSGTQGKGVMFADSFSSASSMMDALSALRQPFLIQEYVDTGGIDTRAIVIGDKVVASMCRESKEGEMRANIHAGGTGRSCELDAHTKRIAVDAAKIIGAEICAVDILDSAKGPVIIELNLSPGLQGITKATKIDIADKIAKFLHQQAKKFKESGKKKDASKIMADIGIKGGEKLKEIITTLDLRGNRILLPLAVTNLTKFNEKEEYIIEADKGFLSIKRFSIGEEEKE
jgi:ribosomal protein S6--L-glutamate ligase